MASTMNEIITLAMTCTWGAYHGVVMTSKKKHSFSHLLGKEAIFRVTQTKKIKSYIAAVREGINDDELPPNNSKSYLKNYCVNAFGFYFSFR